MRRLLAGLVGTAVLAGCVAGPGTAPSASPAAGASSASALPASVSPSAGPSSGSPSASPSADPVAACVDRTLAGMDAAERAGQLFMIGVTGGSAGEVALLRKHRVGAVILMGRTASGVRGTKAIVTRLQRAAPAGLPLLVAADQEGGLVQRLKGAGFSTIPSARTQATWPDATLRARAETWARQLRAAGVRFDLAPVADIVPAGFESANAPIGRLRRGYGSNPAVVSRKVAAVVAGFDAAGVAAAVKHFPGIGRVRGNTDFATGVVDKTTRPDDPGLRPFFNAADAGVGAVMISTVTYSRIDPRHQAVYSAKVLGLLRDRGYAGVLITDDVGAAASLRHVPVAERGWRFVAAGGDLVINVAPGLASRMIAGLRTKAAKEPGFAAKVTASVRRVLTLKADLGLLRCG